jgi:hypothetical protein
MQIPWQQRLVLTTLKVMALLGMGPIELHHHTDVAAANELESASLAVRDPTNRWSITPRGLDVLERART